jgi:hypothetical protein
MADGDSHLHRSSAVADKTEPGGRPKQQAARPQASSTLKVWQMNLHESSLQLLRTSLRGAAMLFYAHGEEISTL